MTKQGKPRFFETERGQETESSQSSNEKIQRYFDENPEILVVDQRKLETMSLDEFRQFEAQFAKTWSKVVDLSVRSYDPSVKPELQDFILGRIDTLRLQKAELDDARKVMNIRQASAESDRLDKVQQDLAAAHGRLLESLAEEQTTEVIEHDEDQKKKTGAA